MARLFVAANSESLSTTTVPITAYPFTLSCWMYHIAASSDVVFGIYDEDHTNPPCHFVWMSSGNVIRAQSRATSGNQDAASSGTGSINTWHHGAARFIAATDRRAYRDGGNEGTNSGSVLFIGTIDVVTVGMLNESTDSLHWDGSIAECAIWNVDIGTDAIASLATGVSPVLVRPDALVFYDPLIRGNSPTGGDSYDIVGGLTLTDANTVTVSAHPPMIYPASPAIITAPAAVGGLTGQTKQAGRAGGQAGMAGGQAA